MTKHSRYSHATFAFDVRCRPGNSGEPEIRHVIIADSAGNQALRQLFEALASDNCRYPVTTSLELQGAVLYMLIDHGIPPAELHAALDRAETYRRDNAEFLPPALRRVHDHLCREAGVPANRYVQPLADGTEWGWPGPLVLIGRLPHASEHYLAIDPADPDTVVVRRDPAWAGQRPHIAFSAADPDLCDRVARLISESSKDVPDRDTAWGDELALWASAARRAAGVPQWCAGRPAQKWGEETAGQVPPVAGLEQSIQAIGDPPIAQWTVPPGWEDSRRAWAEEVARRAPLVPEWAEEEQPEEPEARAAAAKDLTPELLAVYNFTADGPVALPCDRFTYSDGSEWGIAGPVIHEVSGAHRCEYFLALDPDNPDNLMVTRVPAWTLYSSVKIAFAEPDLPLLVLRLLDDRDPASAEWLGHLGSDADDDV